MKRVELASDLEAQADDLVSQGMPHSFQSAVDEPVRLGSASIRGGRGRAAPPETISQPERPNIPIRRETYSRRE
jgi:hypothetical protein